MKISQNQQMIQMIIQQFGDVAWLGKLQNWNKLHADVCIPLQDTVMAITTYF